MISSVCLVLQARVGAQPVTHQRRVIEAEHRAADVPVLVIEAGQLGEAELVHRVGLVGGRRRRPQQVLVPRGATGEVAQARLVVRRCTREYLAAQHVAEVGNRRSDHVADDCSHLVAPSVGLRSGELGRRSLPDERVTRHAGAQQPVVVGDGLGDTTPRREVAHGHSVAEPVHPPVDEGGDAIEFGDVPLPVTSGHEAVARHQHRQKRREVERSAHQPAVAHPRQQRRRRRCAERHRRQQRDVLIIMWVNVGTSLRPLAELAEPPDSLGHARPTQILPPLDLVDVPAIDVPQLRRVPVVRPVLVRQHASPRHRSTVRPTTHRRPACRVGDGRAPVDREPQNGQLGSAGPAVRSDLEE